RKCRIPSDLAHIVMGGEYEVTGVIDGNTIVIKTAEPFDDGFSGRGKTDDQMLDESEVDGDW
ncbi:MAG: hypothetical protein ACKPEQ_13080, partial [Dolichospermum sp.]